LNRDVQTEKDTLESDLKSLFASEVIADQPKTLAPQSACCGAGDHPLEQVTEAEVARGTESLWEEQVEAERGEDRASLCNAVFEDSLGGYLHL
jgi:hypothetical protein